MNSERVNRSAAERRAATLGTRRSVKKDWQAAWLLTRYYLHRPDNAFRRRHARQCQTTVRQSAPARSRRTCSKRSASLTYVSRVGAVCVYHARVGIAVEALEARNPCRRRLDGLPCGTESLPPALEKSASRSSRRGGNRHRDLARACADRRTGRRSTTRCSSFRAACGDAHMKTILATGELGTLSNVAKPVWSA